MANQDTAPGVLPDGLLRDYRPLPGVPDELMDPSGGVRPVWEALVNHLGRFSPEEVARRFGRGDQYLRDAGVYYRQYGEEGEAERDWPLSHVPVLIDEAEWNTIADGLTQRADLLEAVCADLYGSNRLVADGHLPARLVAMNPEWLRPMVGVTPRSGYFLHFVSFEIGRGPDGTWWVLSDRTQAPSGAGFALENRVATTRVFSELFPQLNVHRLAGFFRAFRDALQSLCMDGESRVGILTPGPLNDTYYEHAYIARYLGFTLLEGEDLTVRDGRVMVRTVAGLRPASVLWRRLDASWADPLELDERSRLGTAGMVSALRQGSITLVNALGAGVLETRALLAFMPRICKAVRGEELALPNIATWWCGQDAEREHVKANAERMMIGTALSTRLPFAAEETTVIGGQFRGRVRGTVENWLDRDGPNLVGQEAVTLSTTPAYADGALVPRPLSLRVFLARTPQGWVVMPGGFARIGRSGDAQAIAMQAGGSVADVWVVSDKPVDTGSMLPGTSQFRYSQPSVLPSRAADNLFWLGRYVERAEGAIRMLRSYHARLAESADPGAPLLKLIAGHLEIIGVETGDSVPSGLIAILNSSVNSAGKVRDRFSPDGWNALTDLADSAQAMVAAAAPGDETARAMGLLLRRITGFSGLVHENMYRFTGWRFLSVGRSLERAGAMAAILSTFAGPKSPEGGLDLAIEVGDSIMTHRRRYAVTTSRETVIDLLALDNRNPRAIAYQFSEIRDHIAHLPGSEIQGHLSDLSRTMLQTQTDLAVSTPETLTTEALITMGGRIAAISDLLSSTYLH